MARRFVASVVRPGIGRAKRVGPDASASMTPVVVKAEASISARRQQSRTRDAARPANATASSPAGTSLQRATVLFGIYSHPPRHRRP
jgi:hypothetical protein